MFSKKLLVIGGVFFLVIINIFILFISSRQVGSSSAFRHIGMGIVSPMQKIVSESIHTFRSIWFHYFYLVSTEKENDILKKKLADIIYDVNQCKETELSNARYRSLLNFKNNADLDMLSAEVIAKDPSQWYKSLVIDKGISDGISKGFPVLVPEGVVGQIIDVSDHYAKVLLIIDSNSAVDALIQPTRTHGIIKGDSEGGCKLNYVSRKEVVNTGVAVISSGLDGVFPKGLLIGQVTNIIRNKSGIFQEIIVTPYVDFDRIEEVLIILNQPVQKKSR
jgi:rod shape-determining protein MreC